VNASLQSWWSSALLESQILRSSSWTRRKPRALGPTCRSMCTGVGLRDKLRSFGYPEGQFGQSGIPIVGELGGLEPTRVGGVEVFPIAGLNLDNVDGGYSGAPVVNEATQKVIGLVHAKHHDTQAFIVPLAPLFAAWPELDALHDVFERIRRGLGEEAKAKLAEKLHAAPFIPLNLQAGVIPEEGAEIDEAGRGSDAREHAHRRHWESFNLERLLPPKGPFVLSSDAGTGKTTFLYWLASELVQQSAFVPFVMYCEELERSNPTALRSCSTSLPIALRVSSCRWISKPFSPKRRGKASWYFSLTGWIRFGAASSRGSSGLPSPSPVTVPWF
jgi:hypothetical protein